MHGPTGREVTTVFVDEMSSFKSGPVVSREAIDIALADLKRFPGDDLKLFSGFDMAKPGSEGTAMVGSKTLGRVKDVSFDFESDRSFDSFRDLYMRAAADRFGMPHGTLLSSRGISRETAFEGYDGWKPKPKKADGKMGSTINMDEFNNQENLDRWAAQARKVMGKE